MEARPDFFSIEDFLAAFLGFLRRLLATIKSIVITPHHFHKLIENNENKQFIRPLTFLFIGSILIAFAQKGYVELSADLFWKIDYADLIKNFFSIETNNFSGLQFFVTVRQ